MTASANFQSPRSGYTTMESATALGTSRFLQGLGSELVFTQEASGRYRSFHWQGSQRYGLTNEQVLELPPDETFRPIAIEAYREQIQRILEQRLPERCIHSFCYQEQLFPFEVVISPILEADGKATTVLVMGHLLPEAAVQNVIDSLMPLSLDPNQKLLTQIARKIRRTLDLETIWEQTVKNLGKRFKSVAASSVLTNPNRWT